jgi:hypothetical protein
MRTICGQEFETILEILLAFNHVSELPVRRPEVAEIVAYKEVCFSFKAPTKFEILFPDFLGFLLTVLVMVY